LQRNPSSAEIGDTTEARKTGNLLAVDLASVLGLGYYLRPFPVVAFFSGPRHRERSRFDLWNDLWNPPAGQISPEPGRVRTLAFRFGRCGTRNSTSDDDSVLSSLSLLIDTARSLLVASGRSPSKEDADSKSDRAFQSLADFDFLADTDTSGAGETFLHEKPATSDRQHIRTAVCLDRRCTYF
jgi:hypothetical protein